MKNRQQAGRMGGFRGRALGLLLGFVADRMVGDPGRWHPVAGFGKVAGQLEKVTYRDARWAGAAHTTVLVGVVVGAGWQVRRAGIWPVALATWVVLGGRSLGVAGQRIAGFLEVGDVSGARAGVPALCGRDPEVLDEAGIARAAVESVAENTSDAVIAPLVWGGVAGAAGLLGYRAINTLDAMIGYRTARYCRFGWWAARLDDWANWVPARVTVGLTALVAPVIGGRAVDVWRAVREVRGRHPSPNAGLVEAAAAGALGVRLGGRTEYRHGVQQRPELGFGRIPEAGDVRRAVRLAAAVGWAAVTGLVLLAAFGV